MDRIKGLLGTLLFVFSTLSYADNLATTSPVGYWKSLDRITGKPKNIIQITQAKDNTLVGKIIKIFPGSTYEETPVVGTVILQGLVAQHHQWRRGKLFDLDNGKTYDCSLRLGDKGQKLNVFGYIGIPLLGRSQIWERVDLMSEKS